MRELRRQKRRDLYVNPLTKAYEYKKMMEKKNLTQSQLARELGISRVRVTHMLNLLKLPIERQNYILEHGKEKFIPLENALLSYSSGLFQILRR